MGVGCSECQTLSERGSLIIPRPPEAGQQFCPPDRTARVPGKKASSGQIEISARAEEVGDNEGSIDAAIEGEEARIAFNSKYLMGVFGALDEEEVMLEVTTSSSPGVFRPVEGEDWVQVIMPMFVQW